VELVGFVGVCGAGLGMCALAHVGGGAGWECLVCCSCDYWAFFLPWV